jgi:hypothetical protein
MDARSVLSDLFDTLNKRGVMSGLYIASIIVTLAMSHPDIHLSSDPNAWILVVGVLVIGMIIASVTFEIFIPLFQLFTSPIVLWRFQTTVGGKIRERIPNYTALRRFRESFLATEGSEHLKERIIRDENIRILLTYLGSGSIANFALIAGAMFLVPEIPPQVTRLLLIFTGYVFAGTIIGEITRSSTYGLSMAMAYLQKEKPAS